VAIADALGYSHVLPRRSMGKAAGLTAIVLLWVVSATALDWGANLSETYGLTKTDTVRTGVFDQQYRLYANGQLLPDFDYFAGVNYRRLTSSTGDSGSSWQTELLPSVSAVWSPPMIKLRSDLTFRDNRDEANINRLKGHSIGFLAQSIWNSLPRLTGRYLLDENVNDLVLLGLDTRQRTLSGTAEYTFSTTSLRYEYADSRTENRTVGLEQTSVRHAGHLDNSFSAFDHLLSVQSSYDITVKSDRETQAGADGVLIPLSPLSGMWAVNPNPELGALDLWAGLIDGNLDSAASRQMNLSGSDVQNFGMDFGSAMTVDHIFLYTDSLANPDLRWAVYSSSDNNVWTQTQGYRTYPFSVVFRRYEIAILPQTARYIKLVLEPQPATSPVYVTEIRGLLTRSANTNPGWATDHEAAVHAGIRPSKWIAGALDGTLIRHGASLNSVERQQLGMMGSLHLSPTKFANMSGQYQLNRTEYPDAAGGQTDTELLGFTMISNWLESVRSTVALNRQREITAQSLTRRLNGGSVRLDLKFIPGLEGATEGGLTEDHRILAGDLFKTRYIGQTLQAQPTNRIQISADYRFYWLHSEQGWTPPYRENVTLQANWRLTGTLQFLGNASQFREPGSTYATWESILSWNPTEKLVLSGSADRTLPDQGGSTLLLSAQGLFRWSTRSDVSVTYSYLDSQQAAQANSSNLRLAFTLRI
jgi:hypothetical protein